MTRETKIKAEYGRLSSIFEELDENQRAVADGLIQEAAFLRTLLDDLKETITKNGTTSHYAHGPNQQGTTEAAEVKVYNSLLRNYREVISKLLRITPPDKKTPASVLGKRIEKYDAHAQGRAREEFFEIVKQCGIEADGDSELLNKLLRERGVSGTWGDYYERTKDKWTECNQ